MKVKGTIVNAYREGQKYRLEIACSADPFAQGEITGYISRRQAELLRELHGLYEVYYSKGQGKKGG